MKFSKQHIWSIVLVTAGIGSIRLSIISFFIYILGAVIMWPSISIRLKLLTAKLKIVAFISVLILATVVVDKDHNSSPASSLAANKSTIEEKSNQNSEIKTIDNSIVKNQNCLDLNLKEIKDNIENTFKTKMTRYGNTMPWYYGREVDKKNLYAVVIGYENESLKNIAISNENNQKYKDFGQSTTRIINGLINTIGLKPIKHPNNITEPIQLEDMNDCWKYSLNYQPNVENPNGNNWSYTFELYKK